MAGAPGRPLVDGVGSNVTAWSYVDRLNVGLRACPDRLADLDEVAERMRATLGELLQRAFTQLMNRQDELPDVCGR